MRILRTQELDIFNAGDIRVGDQIQVGKYTATCQEVKQLRHASDPSAENFSADAVFLLDQYLDRTFPMNEDYVNHGPYEESELRHTIGPKKFVQTDENFADIIEHMVPFMILDHYDYLRIPTIGEMFGESYNTANMIRFESDEAEQWPLMKDRKNRIALHSTVEWESGWLQNRTTFSKRNFACVCNYGTIGHSFSSTLRGVRPVFQLYFPASEG